MLIKTLFLLLLLIAGASTINAKQDADPLKKFDKVRVDDQNFDKIRNMHINWYATSIKALMGQLGKELFAKLDRDEQHLLSRCLDKIDDKKDLVLSARCLVLARKRYKRKLRNKNFESEEIIQKNNGWTGGFRIDQSRSEKRPHLKHNIALANQNPVRLYFPYTDDWMRKKNHKLIYSKKQTKLFKSRPHLLGIHTSINKYVHPYPFKFNKPMSKRLNALKYKRVRRSLSWFRQSKDEAGRFANRMPISIDAEPWKVKQANHISLTAANDRSPVSRITDLISMFVKTPTQNETDVRSVRDRHSQWSHTYNKLLKMKKTIDEKERSPGARAYSLRMYDLVLGNDHPTQSSQKSRTPKGLVEMAMDLFNRVGGDRNRPDRLRSNAKFLSPRFAPLMPDKVEADKSELSPTILAFYDEPTSGNKTYSNNIASIPQILKATGMEKKDSDAVLSMIMDVSGARDTVEDALGMLNKLNFFGIEGEIMGATEKIASVYDNLEKSMKPTQSKALNSRGFAFLDMDQINKVYRDPVLNVPEEAMDFDSYALMNEDQREESLWKTIEKIAINRPEDPLNKNFTEHRRLKRAGSLSVPSVLAPTVLAPFMFSPVFGLIVLGPTVLSPNIFSPLILNPAALGIPFILSPYLLSPYVLSPLVMAPFILNPYVLSPNVLNPYVLSPLILSPLVLCPDVISPMVLGGAILSPSVASPAVFTETYLMANVLSPSFLS